MDNLFSALGDADPTPFHPSEKASNKWSHFTSRDTSHINIGSKRKLDLEKKEYPLSPQLVAFLKLVGNKVDVVEEQFSACFNKMMEAVDLPILNKP